MVALGRGVFVGRWVRVGVDVGIWVGLAVGEAELVGLGVAVHEPASAVALAAADRASSADDGPQAERMKMQVLRSSMVLRIGPPWKAYLISTSRSAGSC